MVRQYLPQTNEKYYNMLQYPMWHFLPTFYGSKHSPCMPYQSDSYCKLEGQYFEPTIKLMGKIWTRSWRDKLVQQKQASIQAFETAYTTANFPPKEPLYLLYWLCTLQRCHNNQGNSTEIHEDEKLSSHQAFRSDDTTTSKLYRRRLVSYHVQGVKDYSTFH